MDQGGLIHSKVKSTMWVEKSEVRGVAVLRPSASIHVGIGVVALRSAVRATLEEGANKVIIDLSKVAAVDEDALHVFFEAERTVTGSGGQFKLTGMTPAVRELFEMTKLTTVFDIYEHEADAVDALS